MHCLFCFDVPQKQLQLQEKCGNLLEFGCFLRKLVIKCQDNVLKLTHKQF